MTPDDESELVRRIKEAIKTAEDSQPINPFNFDWRGEAARATIAVVLEDLIAYASPPNHPDDAAFVAEIEDYAESNSIPLNPKER